MSYFHLINCLALSYAPYFITYKYSGLNEYSSVWRCLQAAFGYFLTQLVKLLLLATFFPTSDYEGFAFFPELLRSSADVVDVIGMHIIMSNFLTGKGEIRFLSGGLGWGAAHSIASRLILLWVGARATAFSWRWVQTSLDSTSDMVLFLAMAALTWMATRSSNRATVYLLLVAAVFHGFVHQLMFSAFQIRGWSMVVARFTYSMMVAGGALYNYANWGVPAGKRD